MFADEAPIDPHRPIIDPHLHLWDILPIPGSLQAPQRFLLEETRGAIEGSGHNITHSVFVECHAMYRADGPPELRSLGETEFVNGVAAVAASGKYGPCRIAHRIVGNADLLLGAAVAPVLERHVAAAGERFRGIRTHTAFSEGGLFGHPCDPAMRGAMTRPAFVEGARALAAMDLSLDVWCVHSQLGELAALADALPQLTIILDHVGTPLGVETMNDWKRQIAELAKRPNVQVKLGGLGMDLSRSMPAETGPASSAQLAAAWRPCIETCIEAFGPARAMFESNFPPDKAAGSYGATWNAFKRIASGASQEEQDLLFRRTAAQTYRIALD